MADAAVEFLLGNLQQLLTYHTHLIKEAKGPVEMLKDDLLHFKAFLRDSTKKRRKDAGLRELVRQIRDVVYEAEVIIDVFVTMAAEIKSRPYIGRVFKSPVNLHGIARQVEAVGHKVREIYDDKTKLYFANLTTGDGDPDEPEGLAPIVREVNVVGFEDEAETLIGYLKENTGQLDVISIIGMPGLGKTTLARKIYGDEQIRYEFPTRIWVYVSQVFTKKDIYFSILREFTRITEEMQQKKDDELAELVYAYLKKGKFLIVMDDVWTVEDWRRIQVVLPRTNGAGKILITSRLAEVGRCASCQREPHLLRFLNKDESWILLRYEVFGKSEFHPELQQLGKLIASGCDGLPLAIGVIGGILAKKFSPSDDMTAKVTAWTKVSDNVKAYLKEDPFNRVEKIIALSYDKLPDHLRACFLYLAMFPEDYEIPVWKLIRMWIAEGFIQQEHGISSEGIAENYLDELINRNLVRVERRRPDGRVKTCRIHDMLRDFCKNEAAGDRENFLEEIKKTTEGFDHHVYAVQKCRRICIHANVLSFIRLRPFGPNVRSFVCFSKEEFILPQEHTSAIPAAFKLLRVLDVKPIKFRNIPSDMYQLVHLRYVTLSINSGFLPSDFSMLWNLETLIVHTSSPTLDIRFNIWTMIRLSHLATNAPAILKYAEKTSRDSGKLQILSTISPRSCQDKFFNEARYLKKLGIRGKLSVLLDGKTGSFKHFSKLVRLEKLMLLNDVFPGPSLEGGLHPNQFPPNLKSLTLSSTFLDWSHMHILAALKHLEVLKLKNNAFVGMFWEPQGEGFQRLEILCIDRMDLTFWTPLDHYYHRQLKCLELRNCENLVEIPLSLATIPTFQVLNLYHCEKVIGAAESIRKAKQAQNLPDGKFKLSILI